MIKLFSIWLLLVFPYIIWGQIEFSSQILIDDTEGVKWSVFTCDLDNDGDEDVLSIISNNIIAWFENTDGRGSFSSQKMITDTADRLSSLYPIDIDGDNDIDVLSAENETVSNNGTLDVIGKICLYENIDGEGAFEPRKVISSSMKTTWCVHAADIDNDSDNDIMSASHHDHKIAWYENTDGNGSFGDQIILNTFAVQATFVSAGDLDGDNDLDILSSCRHYDNLVWYENINNTFSTPITIGSDAENASCIFAVDIDNDNDLDVLSSCWDPQKIVWYENTDGKGNFGNQQIISEQTNDNIIIIIDFESDGDLDILSSKGKDIFLHENIVETKSFVTHKIITCETTFSPESIDANDLDSDGDIDIVAGFLDELYWFENLTNSTSIQDNNADLPDNFQLYQNYPNPFNPSTMIKYNLEKPCNIILTIYNLTGEQVETLVNEYQATGEYQVLWQTEGLPSGIYFCRLQSGKFSESRKLILQK